MGDVGGPDETDGLDVRMLEDRVDRDLVAMDAVEDASRRPGFKEEFSKAERDGRVLLGRFQDERVAAGDCDG